MLPGSNPDNSPDKRVNRSGARSNVTNQNDWEGFNAFGSGSNAEIVLKNLELIIAPLELAPAHQDALRNAIRGCIQLAPESALILTANLKNLRDLPCERQQTICLTLESFFSSCQRIPALTLSPLYSPTLKWLEESTSASVLYSTVRFLSDNPDFFSHPRYSSVFQTIQKLLLIPGFEGGKELAQIAQIEIIERAVTEHWRNNYLEKVLETFRSPNHTSEGYNCRLELLEAPARGQAKLTNELESITTIEASIASLDLDPIERARIFVANRTTSLAKCLSGFSRPSSRKQLILLLSDTSSIPASDRAYQSIVNILRNNAEETSILHLRALQHLVDTGCSLELAILLMSPGKNYLGDLADVLEPLVSTSHQQEALNAQLYRAIDSFSTRLEKSTRTNRYETIDLTIKTLVDGFPLSDRSDRRVSAQTLTEPASLRKLLLCLNGAGLPDREAICSISGLVRLLTELSADEDINNILSLDPLNSESAHIDFMDKYHADNPPFSIFNTPDDIQEKFTAQVWSVFMRAPDGHHGFWSNTYEFRHTPIGNRCPHDQMMKRWKAENHLIPVSDIDAFPGRGRYVKNLDLSAIFGSAFDERIWTDEVLSAYGPLKGVETPGNLHAFYNLERSEIGHTRAFDFFSVPSNPFFSFCGEPLTIMTWNHHFDATGTKKITLVPTRALLALIGNFLIPIDNESATNYRGPFDLSKNPPTLEAIRHKATEMGLPISVIDVTSPSAFTGGLCNGIGKQETRYYSWENSQQAKDKFDRSHKWHIRDDKRKLSDLHYAHQRIYEITTAYLNVRDLYKFAVGLDARSFNAQPALNGYGNSPWGDQSMPVSHGYEKLKFFCEFSSEYRALNKRHLAPAIVIAPMKYMAPEATSPIVLDGVTGFGFHQWGKPFDIDIYNGELSQTLIEMWSRYVDPLLDQDDHFWYAPRLVSRENYLEQMEQYGYRK